MYTLRIFLRSRIFKQLVAHVIGSALHSFESSPSETEPTASAILWVLWKRAWSRLSGLMLLGALFLILPSVLLSIPRTALPKLWQSFTVLKSNVVIAGG